MLKTTSKLPAKSIKTNPLEYIYHSDMNSPIGKISFFWILKPRKTLISIKLHKNKETTYIPSDDKYVLMFTKKTLQINKIEFIALDDYAKYPEFIQLLIKQINSYFNKKVPFAYPLKYISLEILSEFSKKNLLSLSKVPFGGLISYKGLAEKAGYPNAYRAVGTVMNKNPYPLIIPCHRVIKKDNTIGGFAPGIDIKKLLLRHEQKKNVAQASSL